MMAVPKEFRRVHWGVETLPPHGAPPRHQHREGYANVLLRGSFVEAGFAGRWQMQPGEVLLHGAFDCHANADYGRAGPQVLRLPWDGACEGRFHVADPEALVRIAERDPYEAMEALKAMLIAPPYRDEDWPVLLARDLTQQPRLSLTGWAEAHGLRRETLSRGFAKAYGVSAKAFRLEARTRRAWQAVMTSPRSLTEIAHAAGFADLAHMSRSISTFTGFPPRAWRARSAA